MLETTESWDLRRIWEKEIFPALYGQRPDTTVDSPKLSLPDNLDEATVTYRPPLAPGLVLPALARFPGRQAPNGDHWRGLDGNGVIWRTPRLLILDISARAANRK
jgi:hypothetical protein